jgi:hypothetical protein
MIDRISRINSVGGISVVWFNFFILSRFSNYTLKFPQTQKIVRLGIAGLASTVGEVIVTASLAREPHVPQAAPLPAEGISQNSPLFPKPHPPSLW